MVTARHKTAEINARCKTIMGGRTLLLSVGCDEEDTPGLKVVEWEKSGLGGGI